MGLSASSKRFLREMTLSWAMKTYVEAREMETTELGDVETTSTTNPCGNPVWRRKDRTSASRRRTVTKCSLKRD